MNRAPDGNAAANQPCATLQSLRQDPVEISVRQASERRLERLRCERRQVVGHSNQATLISGQILRVFGHPENVFNDQWLLTEVRHAGKQPHLLQGLDLIDIARILDHDPPETECAPFTRGYRNQFRAIPWAMPYRPPLTQRKPQIHGYQTATLLGTERQPARRDMRGRVQVRFHWPPHAAAHEATHWLPVAIPQKAGDQASQSLLAGSQVVVSFFDNDPDRPVICDLISCAETTSMQPQIHIDGLPLQPVAERIHLSQSQTLHARAKDRLTLNSPQTQIELDAEGIRITGPQSLASRLNPSGNTRGEVVAPTTAQPDLSALFQWLDCP